MFYYKKKRKQVYMLQVVTSLNLTILFLINIKLINDRIVITRSSLIVHSKVFYSPNWKGDKIFLKVYENLSSNFEDRFIITGSSNNVWVGSCCVRDSS